MPVFRIGIDREAPPTFRANSETSEETLMGKLPNTNLNIAVRTCLHQKSHLTSIMRPKNMGKYVHLLTRMPYSEL